MDRGNGNNHLGAGTPASRAEKFEDEKRRIIDSCFSKKEPDGSRELHLLNLAELSGTAFAAI